MDIKLSCSICNCEGFKLDTIQVKQEDELIFLLGECPYCRRFVRISLNETIKDALKEVQTNYESQ